jgi:hypothetical protein
MAKRDRDATINWNAPVRTIGIAIPAGGGTGSGYHERHLDQDGHQSSLRQRENPIGGRKRAPYTLVRWRAGENSADRKRHPDRRAPRTDQETAQKDRFGAHAVDFGEDRVAVRDALVWRATNPMNAPKNDPR